MATNFGHTDIVQILAPLTENPNAPNAFGLTPIQKAAFNGYSEIVLILAPLTKNPNAPNPYGSTPIHKAALKGQFWLCDFTKFLFTNVF